MRGELCVSVTRGHMKGLDERLAEPAVFPEIGGIARHRQAQQPDAVGKATQDRLILGDGTAVEFYGERQSGAHVGRCRPSRVEWPSWAELIDLRDQPLVGVACVVAEQHGVAQKPWQAFE